MKSLSNSCVFADGDYKLVNLNMKDKHTDCIIIMFTFHFEVYTDAMIAYVHN